MTVSEELELVRSRNPEGRLIPEAVVAFAKSPKTALHERFTWDDSEAARQYRIWQAREIIRVTVTLLPNSNQQTRVYVSLMDDRQEDGGGYRPLVDVLGSPALRAKLLGEALSELIRIKARYKQLNELSRVFDAVDEAAAASNGHAKANGKPHAKPNQKVTEPVG